jgi:ATP-dependent Lon protease
MDHASPDQQLSPQRDEDSENFLDTGATDTKAQDGDDPSKIDHLPEHVPVLPVRNLVVFPGTVVPLTIGREKSRLLIDEVLAGDRLVATFTQRNETVEDPDIDDVYRVGTVARVLKLLQMPDGSSSLLVHGVARVGLERFVTTDPYWKAVVHMHEDAQNVTLELEALVHSARHAAEQVIELSPNVPDEARLMLSSIEDPGALADFLAANLSLGVVQKQELLETFDVGERLKKVNVTLTNQLELLQLSQKIQTDVRTQIDKTQRHYFLQEQLRAIQKELGESDGQDDDVEQLRQRVTDANMPEVVLREAERELGRLERIAQASPEYGVVRDYLEYLCEMPWHEESEEILDLVRAEKILNDDHYGLDRIKRRILEALAVRQLNPEARSPILCFAGPPGVGKTSLGQSIARALNRKFIRIALGGVRDEADIRGHRRTYIGAIPGRIIQEIRKAGTRNPVIMLDELDKLGADFRGDPASALLEVLDPQQNNTFTDHYLAVPFDLSRVLFIGTANYMDPVAPALKDRMEVINLAGYTSAEKLQIAKRYLVPRQIKLNGLTEHNVKFDDRALTEIIEHHTREAGVRNLERAIGTVCRYQAAEIARKHKVPKTIRIADLEAPLGQPKFQHEVATRERQPGVATGLAYTPVGGEIIYVEALAMPGRGGFTLTGQIGDVMRESAQAALSLIRSRADAWNLDLSQLSQTDVHVHVPAGGIPKDGPSAGIAMVTALTSLFSGQPVTSELGMTGEVTLRGHVLPIGGVKEKLLAAHRAGLKAIVLPRRNEADLGEVPAEVRERLKFTFADRIEEVLAVALPELAIKPSSSRKKPRSTSSRSSKKTTTSRKATRKKTSAAKQTKSTRRTAKSTARKGPGSRAR